MDGGTADRVARRAERRPDAVALVDVATARLGWRATPSSNAVQLHGGTGYLHGVEVERHDRDARILGIGGGRTEIMNEDVAGRSGLDP